MRSYRNKFVPPIPLEIQKKSLLSVYETLGFKSMQDWYHLDTKEAETMIPPSQLLLHNGSFPQMLKSAFPEHSWKIWRFDIPESHWEALSSERKYLERLAKRLGFSSMDSWYRMTAKRILYYGGRHLMSKYGGSPSQMLLRVFPEHPWVLGKFSGMARSWSSLEVVEWLSEQLEVERLEDWYRISFSQIRRFLPNSAVNKHSLGKILQEVYPEHPWDMGKIAIKSGRNKSSQRRLFLLVKELFPDSVVSENYKHLELEWRSKRLMELDIYLPAERVAFEYQGEGHFHDIYTMGVRWRQRQMDEEKRQACKDRGITLIEIPYWWDFEKPSLVATIQQSRIDLLFEAESGEPIPEQPLEGFVLPEGKAVPF